MVSPRIELPRSLEPRISIVIPSKSPELLRAALGSIAADSGSGVSFETIVVANGVGPEVAEAIEQVAEGVQVVRSSVQRGVAGGYNLGRRSARGELIVLMHDDVEVEPGWLQAWIDASDAHPEAGVIGSKVLFPDGTLRGAGNILWRDGTTSPPWRGKAPPSDAFDTPRPVDYTPSCSALVRAVTWDAVGGLNEALYPAYYVDVDLAMAARQAGWAVIYWPHSRVRHRASSASGQRRRAFVAARNREMFLLRWGDELAQQPAEDSDISDAIASAAERTPTRRPPVGPRPVPPAEAEADYARLERELDEAFLRHLDDQLDTAEARLSELEAQRTACYVLGSPVEFMAGGSAGKYRSSGGHAAEEWGRWVGDEPFAIELPLAGLGSEVPVPQPTTLELDVVHFLCETRPLSRIAIEVDGVRVLDVDEVRDGPVRYTAPIIQSPRDGRRCRCTTIVVRSEGAVSPAATGQSADARPLTVGLISLTLR